MYMFCENDKLYLRPLILKDSDFIYELKEKNKNFILNYAEVSKNAQKEKIKNSISKDDELYLLITLKETSNHIGYIHSKFFNNGKIADIDFVINENNSKLMEESLILFRKELFKQGCIRLECNICSSNLLGKKILENLDFKLEGTKEMSYFNNNNFFDILVFASLNR
ncbi:hypothetical protein UT300019_13100 [Clostridium sp. CTA-19]